MPLHLFKLYIIFLFRDDDKRVRETEVEIDSSNSNENLDFIAPSKQIENIISRSSQTDQEQRVKLIKLLDRLKKYERVKLSNLFDAQLSEIFRNNLGDCTTEFQQALLDILEFFAIYGNFNITVVLDSGLLEKIEQLLNFELKNQENSNNSDIAEQLSRIYFYLIAYNICNLEVIKICSNIFNKQIINLNEKLQSENDNQKNETIIKIANKNEDKFEKDLRNGIKTLNCIGFSCYEYGSMFAKEYKLDEKITQMIHVNCSEELNCPKRIVSRQSSVVNEFQITILSVFGELSDISIDVDDYLPKGFGIIAHLEPIIISPFLTLSNEIQSPEDALISSRILCSALNLLNVLFCYNLFHQIEIAVTTPNLLIALVKLIEFNRKVNKHSSQQRIYDSYIRRFSLECISHIFQVENENIFKWLIEAKYINSLLDTVCIGGRITEENDEVIKYSLRNISQLISFFLMDKQQQQPQQSEWCNKMNDLFEQYGNIEDIQALLFTSNNMHQIKISASITQKNILNHFLDATNGRNNFVW